jgi:putative ABC transport system permease protein
MRQWLRRFRHRPSDEEFAAEVEAHLAHETDERIERGLPPEEAHYVALRRFGNVTRHLERFREASPWFWLHTAWQDLRYAWRSLKRAPALFAAAILSLALGIGGSTALFSVLYGIVIHPLTYPHSERLTLLASYDRERGGAPSSARVRAGELGEYTGLGAVFQGAAGFYLAGVSLNGGNGSVEALQVTCNFFDVAGVSAQLGRTLREEDCSPGAIPVMVLSHELWASRFASNPAVLGQALRMDALYGRLEGEDRRVATVVGIMPERVSIWSEKAWMPSHVDVTAPDQRFYVVLARLREGVTRAQAGTRVASLSRRLASAAPSDPARNLRPYGVEFLRDQTVRSYETTVVGLVAGVCCVLLIACVNVATLLFARTMARQAEIGVRVSLGASRGRIVRQFVIESLVLTLGGGLVGTMVAAALMPPLAHLILATHVVASQAAIRINGPSLLVAAVTVIVAALIFGIIPALYVMRRDPGRALVSGSRTTGAPRGDRWRAALVATQIALAFPVFCATAALLHSFTALQGSVTRYRPDYVLEVNLGERELLSGRYESEERRASLWRDLDDALEHVPGVSASVSTAPMLFYRPKPASVQLVGASGTAGWTAQLRCISADFLPTMGVAVLHGRALLDTDERSRRRVVVVNRSFARMYFGSSVPIGQQIRLQETPWLCPARDEPLEIVGVVEDTPSTDPLDMTADAVVPTVYAPQSLATPPYAHILVRTAMPAGAVAHDVRRAIASVDPNLKVETQVLRDGLETMWTSWPRLVVSVAGSFAVVSLVLVLVGVFGVLSYSITQLSREIGVRMALGGSPARIGRDVLGRGLRWTLLGVTAGTVITWALFAVASSRVWGLGALNIFLLAGAAGLVVLMGVGTAWFPARRAMRVDPVEVLRAE